MYTVTCWSIQSLVKSTSSRTHFYCKQKLVSWQPLFLRSNFTLLGHALFQKLTLVSTFWCLFRVYATKTTNFRFWGSKCDQNDTFLGVELGQALFQKLKLVSTFSCLFRGYATKTTNFGSWGRSSRVATLHTLLSLQWHGSRRLEDVRRNQHQIVGHQIVNRI